MTPPGLVPGGISSAAFADLLARAMAIGKAAALLLDPGMEASALAWLQRDLMPRLADRDFAVIVKDRPDIVTSIDADGLHLTDPAELKRLRGKLGDLSIGATSPLGRHEAMIAAELGADYIAFDATVPDVGSGAGMEQALLDGEGLPNRPWYQHLIYAPGINTGYGVKTLPGVREAIEERRWDEANRYVVRTAKVLDAYSARIESARAAL